jgi:ketosteroid isomerase-like protein
MRSSRHGAPVLLGLAVLLTMCGRPVAEPESVLSMWFRHIERSELDSLRPLLASDFVFVSDGATMTADAFVTMIKGLGIERPRVRLFDVMTHRNGDVAYLVYHRDETIETNGQTRTFPEVGTLVVRRHADGWQIALWTATSSRR